MSAERSGAGGRARVSLETRSLWKVRFAQALPRYLLCAVSLAGLAASTRMVIAPPRAGSALDAEPAPAPADRAAEGFAALFARRYLSWSATAPQSSERALESFSGPGLEPNAGVALPATGEQQVEWVEVVQAREPALGLHVYTVAAQTDTAGLLYLSVGVTRTQGQGVALSGYPALVGPPASAPTPAAGHLREVTDGALQTVVERSLRNYLSASGGELAADLAGGARVSLPAFALSLQSISHLTWATQAQSVLALVQAEDARGVRYTLAYEVDVVRAQGRWEISAIEMDPDA